MDQRPWHPFRRAMRPRNPCLCPSLDGVVPSGCRRELGSSTAEPACWSVMCRMKPRVVRKLSLGDLLHQWCPMWKRRKWQEQEEAASSYLSQGLQLGTEPLRCEHERPDRFSPSEQSGQAPTSAWVPAVVTHLHIMGLRRDLGQAAQSRRWNERWSACVSVSMSAGVWTGEKGTTTKGKNGAPPKGIKAPIPRGKRAPPPKGEGAPPRRNKEHHQYRQGLQKQ